MPRPLYPRERVPGIGGWVDPRAGLDDMKKWKFLTLPGLELWPPGRPAHSQSLYWLCYPGSKEGSIQNVNGKNSSIFKKIIQRGQKWVCKRIFLLPLNTHTHLPTCKAPGSTSSVNITDICISSLFLWQQILDVHNQWYDWMAYWSTLVLHCLQVWW
jgi:hypothetical protein